MAKTRSEYYSRTRLLNQLGLFQEPLPKISAVTPPRAGIDHGSCSSPECQHTSSSSHASMVPFEMKLNDTWQERTSMGRWSCHSSVTSDSLESCEQQVQQVQQQQKHHIHFKETVSVIPIPSRYQYSDRIKQRIWSNRIELREMAQRNMIEFESEGYDWRNVVLEDDMYIDAGNGNYVHPCHLRNSYDPQKSSLRLPPSRAGSASTDRIPEEVLGLNNEGDEEDDYCHFAPLRRLDSTVMA